MNSFNGIEAKSNGIYQGEGGACDDDAPYVYGNLYQCVEYVRRYYGEELGLNTDSDAWRGDARFYWAEASNRGLESYNNNGGFAPQVEDIIVFDGGRWGHVGIITDVEGDEVTIIEQNWDPRGEFKLDLTISSNGQYFVGNRSRRYSTIGWLRKPGNEYDTRSLRGDWDVKIYYDGRLTFTPVWEIDRDGTYEECEDGFACASGEWFQLGSQVYFTIPGLADFHGLVSTKDEDRMEGTLFNSFFGEGTWEARR
ncbi:MAG: CHAP domain-containing protein [Gammaproteobacteria bacterium]|nr:CHAP domain-containing protein [Gammaproteobacteria bacterium]